MTINNEQNHYPINDWDSAYENGNFIEDAGSYVARWQEKSSLFRHQLSENNRAILDIRYADKARNLLDLFLPDNIEQNITANIQNQTLPHLAAAKGIVFFVHGGYWLDFDKNSWSHLAKGCLDAGFIVAMPSYTLCPQAEITTLIADVAQAIEHVASHITGDIRLSGHSAGGHLVSSMLCDSSALNKATQSRIVKTVSISGLHDLRPLLKNKMNEQLQLTPLLAQQCSPALNTPNHLAPLTCWVGACERPEFIRQNRILADIWKSFEITTDIVEEQGKHHFNVIDGLEDRYHALTQSLLS
ncbi:alpha/beta hydrolase [Gammaproteobacteria bacterium AS21]